MWLVYNFFFPVVKFAYYFLYSVILLQIISILLQSFIKYRLKKAQNTLRNIEKGAILGELPKITIQIDLRFQSKDEPRIFESLKSLDYPNNKYFVQVLVENTEGLKLPSEIVPLEVISRNSFRSETEFIHSAISNAKGDFIVKLYAEDNIESDFFKRAFEKYSLSLERPVIGGIALKRTFNKEGLSIMQTIVNVWNNYYFEVKDFLLNLFGIGITLEGNQCVFWNKLCIESVFPLHSYNDFYLALHAQNKGWKIIQENEVEIPCGMNLSLENYKLLSTFNSQGIFASVFNIPFTLQRRNLSTTRKILALLITLAPLIQILSILFIFLSLIYCTPVPQPLPLQSFVGLLKLDLFCGLLLFIDRRARLRLLILPFAPLLYISISIHNGFTGILSLFHINIAYSKVWNSLIPDSFWTILCYAFIIEGDRIGIAYKSIYSMILFIGICFTFSFTSSRFFKENFPTRMGFRIGLSLAMIYITAKLIEERQYFWESNWELIKPDLTPYSITNRGDCKPQKSFATIDEKHYLHIHCPTPSFYRVPGSRNFTQYFEPTYMEGEYVGTLCNNTFQLLLFPKRVEKFVERSKTQLSKDPSKKYDVLFLLLDAVSTHSFLKHLPATRDLLASLPTEQIKAKSFHFNNFNSVGLDSLVNGLAFESGCAVWDYESKNESLKFPRFEEDKGKIYEFYTLKTEVRACHLLCQKYNEAFDPSKDVYIWNRFQEAGYVTAYGEEICSSRSPWGTDPLFNVKGGLHHDHKYGGFVCDESDIWLDAPYCYAGRFLQSYSIEYINKFWDTYIDIPKMLFVDWVGGHCNHIRQLYTMDEDISKFLEIFLKKHTNTIVLLVADHGATGRYPITKYSKPIFQLVVPDSFLKEFPRVEETLKSNLDQLVTMYDLYNTLSSITTMPENAPYVPDWSQNLWNEKVKERTCNEARIPPMFCVPTTKESRLSTEPIPGLQPEPLKGTCWERGQ